MNQRIACIGAVTLDHVYTVERLLRKNESACCRGYSRNWGGKGLNQTVALKKAGALPLLFAKVGIGEYQSLRAFLKKNEINMDHIISVDSLTNHGVIQIDPRGNTIILGCSTPQTDFTQQEVDRILADFAPGDILYLQNEIPAVPYIMQRGKAKGLMVVLNPSPLDRWERLPLDQADWLILNAVEAVQIAGTRTPEAALFRLAEKHGCRVVLTLGDKGVMCLAEGRSYEQKCLPTRVVDTSGAGDTFLGYFLSETINGTDIQTALLRASQAAALVVSRLGASAIPDRREVLTCLRKGEDW